MNDTPTPTPRTDKQREIIDSIRPDGCHRVEYLLGFASILEILESELNPVTEQLTATREELKAVTEQLDEMTLRWELTNDSLFDKRALVDRLVEALRKIQKVGLVAVDAFDELDRIDEIVDEALQSLNQDHTVATNDMIADVKGGSDE